MTKAGTVQECLHHLVDHTPEKQKTAVVKALSEEMLQGMSAGYSWFRKDSVPKGTHRIRLMFVLSKRGYHVSELLEMKPEMLIWAYLIYMGRVTVEDSAARIGYSSHEAAFAPLIGRQRGMKEPMFGNLKQFVAESGVTLEEVQRLLPTYNQALAQHVEPVERTTCSNDTHDQKEGVKASAVALIKSLGALVPHLVSDSFTAADREDVRKRVGGQGVFVLKNGLAALCSETARKNIVSE